MLQSESKTAYLRKFAAQLSKEREAELVTLRSQLDKYLAGGSFKVQLCSNKPPRTIKTKKQMLGQKIKEPTAAKQAALNGTVFDDGGMVLKSTVG